MVAQMIRVISSPSSSTTGLTTLILNNLIKNHENSTKILDFEGSMIEGVASFYESFGSEVETYNLLKLKFSI